MPTRAYFATNSHQAHQRERGVGGIELELSEHGVLRPRRGTTGLSATGARGHRGFCPRHSASFKASTTSIRAMRRPNGMTVAQADSKAIRTAIPTDLGVMTGA